MFQYFDHITVICWWKYRLFLPKWSAKKALQTRIVQNIFWEFCVFFGWLPMEAPIENNVIFCYNSANPWRIILILELDRDIHETNLCAKLQLNLISFFKSYRVNKRTDGRTYWPILECTHFLSTQKRCYNKRKKYFSICNQLQTLPNRLLHIHKPLYKSLYKPQISLFQGFMWRVSNPFITPENVLTSFHFPKSLRLNFFLSSNLCDRSN
jgi:hypothetical protein